MFIRIFPLCQFQYLLQSRNWMKSNSSQSIFQMIIQVILFIFKFYLMINILRSDTFLPDSTSTHHKESDNKYLFH